MLYQILHAPRRGPSRRRQRSYSDCWRGASTMDADEQGQQLALRWELLMRYHGVPWSRLVRGYPGFIIYVGRAGLASKDGVEGNLIQHCRLNHSLRRTTLPNGRCPEVKRSRGTELNAQLSLSRRSRKLEIAQRWMVRCHPSSIADEAIAIREARYGLGQSGHSIFQIRQGREKLNKL